MKLRPQQPRTCQHHAHRRGVRGTQYHPVHVLRLARQAESTPLLQAAQRRNPHPPLRLRHPALVTRRSGGGINGDHRTSVRSGTGPNGRLFVGERNKKELPKGTINRIWLEVRREVFSSGVAASPLAATPYDLRHAAVSTWLNGGVPPTQVAEWAGQSVEVLLRIDAKCLDGGVQLLRRRIDEALRP